MKFKYHLKIIATAIVLSVASIVGLVVVPIAYILRNKETADFSNIFNWWDNDDNGIYCPNSSYRPSWIKEHSFLDCYYWSAIRNPSRNFSQHVIGYKTETIESFDVLAPGKFGESKIICITKSVDGTEYPMIYMITPLIGEYKFVLKYGWKNWELDTMDANLAAWKAKNTYISFVCYPQIRKL